MVVELPYFGCLFVFISHFLCVFFFSESKETVVKLKSFADNFSSYTHFLQKILPYQLKRSVLCVCVCLTEQWSGGGSTDGYFVFLL